MVSTTDHDNYVLLHFDRQRVKRERVYFIYKINKKQNKTGGVGVRNFYRYQSVYGQQHVELKCKINI